MLLAALGVGVFAAYVQLTPSARTVPPELRKDGPEVTTTAAPRPRRDRRTTRAVQRVELLVPALDGENVKLVPELTSAVGDEAIVFVANGALKAMNIDDARALGVNVKDGLATIDFNAGIEKGYGSMEEATLIKALQMGLGQFKNVSRFQFRVEGRTVESLGHYEMAEPLPVIRPGKTEPDEPAPSTPSEDPNPEQLR